MRPDRLLVTGSRDWNDAAIVGQVLEIGLAALQIPVSRAGLCTLVHGAGRGLDTTAGDHAARMGMTVEPHPADWTQLGRRAGPVRNQEMVAAGAGLCIGFPLGRLGSGVSRGTWGTVAAARAAGIPTLVVWGRRLHAYDIDEHQVHRRDNVSADLLITAQRRCCAWITDPGPVVGIDQLVVPF
ncbi:DUF2493 domain-containing protein [Acidipropionibacterium jensenii]|uniref:DUF2493 domain-containing protein n=1 Tax=Acidipropionibacterium jensenii TaxID=1749 RepID=UPI00214B3FD4